MYGSTAPRRTRNGVLENRITTEGTKTAPKWFQVIGMMLYARTPTIISARRTSTERAQRALAARLLCQQGPAVRRRV